MSGLTLKGPAGGAVQQLPTPLVYLSDSWNGSWALERAATFDAVELHAGSVDVDRLEFLVPYGRALIPSEGNSFNARDPDDLEGQWARLDLVDPAGAATTVFVGQIRGEERRVFGSNSDIAGSSIPRPKGFQTWQALGGLNLLKLAAISHSFWTPPPGGGTGSVTELTWTPGFNRRDARGDLIGNRSDASTGGSYVFGGTNVWTRRQAIDYVLTRFLNKPNAPPFSVGGQTAVLDEDLRVLEIGVTETADQILRKIISYKEGIEFAVRPKVAGGAMSGYEITIFTITAKPITFRTSTIPANPQTVKFDTTDMQDVARLQVATDRSHTASRIRLVGERIVVCATLLGPYLAGDTSGDVLTSTAASLVGKWPTTLETAYKAGDPTADPSDQAKHDEARASQKFETVYLRYALPVGFKRPPAWLPAIDTQGNPIAAPAPYQDAVRETLSQLPLREGYDYTTDPPTNNNPTAAPEPDFKPIFAICESTRAERDSVGGITDPNVSTTSASKYWTISHKIGIGCSALKHDLGVQLHASPNHRLALGRALFDGTDTAESRYITGSATDADGPAGDGNAVDARTLGATIAWRTDARFALEYVLDSNNDDGTVVEFAVPDAQLWVLAPGTIVDVVNGAIMKSPSKAAILRNDADLFAPQMAGLIARYLYGRNRADFTFVGWRPWLGLLGAVLTTIEEGSETHGINAPITSVSLRGGRNAEPTTNVKAGFAA